MDQAQLEVRVCCRASLIGDSRYNWRNEDKTKGSSFYVIDARGIDNCKVSTYQGSPAKRSLMVWYGVV